MSDGEPLPQPFDLALVPLGALVAGFIPAPEDLASELEAAAVDVPALRVERIALDLPLELEVAVDSAGQVLLGGAPPTQHLETSFMPVLHRLRLRITRDGDGQ